jgi:hypothetical protein
MLCTEGCFELVVRYTILPSEGLCLSHWKVRDSGWVRKVHFWKAICQPAVSGHRLTLIRADKGCGKKFGKVIQHLQMKRPESIDLLLFKIIKLEYNMIGASDQNSFSSDFPYLV